MPGSCDELIDFWNRPEIWKSEPDTEWGYLHPDDRSTAWFNLSDVPVPGRLNAPTPGARIQETHIHRSLLPVPFVGNLREGRIFLVMANPGFSGDAPNGIRGDYSAERDDGFRTLLTRNLTQDENCNFFPLDEGSNGTGAREYWLSARGLGRWHKDEEFAQWIKKNLVVLQLLPYHSARWPSGGKGKISALKSVKQMTRYIRSLAESAVKGEVMLVVVRHKDLLDVSLTPSQELGWIERLEEKKSLLFDISPSSSTPEMGPDGIPGMLIYRAFQLR